MNFKHMLVYYWNMFLFSLHTTVLELEWMDRVARYIKDGKSPKICTSAAFYRAIAPNSVAKHDCLITNVPFKKDPIIVLNPETIDAISDTALYAGMLVSAELIRINAWQVEIDNGRTGYNFGHQIWAKADDVILDQNGLGYELEEYLEHLIGKNPNNSIFRERYERAVRWNNC